jgi:hypothetical protein
MGSIAAPVVGGMPAIDGQFPGVGALVYDVGGVMMQGCTGTLIAPDVVLTAAHCVDPSLTSGVVPSFTLSLDAAAPGAILVPGARGVPHPGWDINTPYFDGLGRLNDIGLVFLASPITSVPPMWMVTPDAKDDLEPGLTLSIAGYGVTGDGAGDSGLLRYADTRLIRCNKSEIQVGRGAPEPQNCNGDSGGPAFVDLGDGLRVAGVVSRSYTGDTCTAGGIDTRVDRYLDWIHQQVPEGIPCGSGLTCYDGGCCAAGRGQSGGTVLIALVVAQVLLRRPRRR